MTSLAGSISLRLWVLSSPNKDSVSVYTETESYQPAGQSPHRKRLLWHYLNLTCVWRLKRCINIPWTTIMTSAKDRILKYHFYQVILMLKKSLIFDGCSSFQSPLSVRACSDKTAARSISQGGGGVSGCLLDTLFKFWTPYFICHLHVKVLESEQFGHPIFKSWLTPCGCVCAVCVKYSMQQVLCVFVTLVCTPTHPCQHWRILCRNAQVTNNHQK